MTCKCLNKERMLFFLSVMILVVPPIWELLKLLPAYSFSEWTHPFTGSQQLRHHAKHLATQGVLGILSFFLIVYLFILSQCIPRLKKILCIILVCFLVGGLGPWFNKQKKIGVHYGDKLIEKVSLENSKWIVHFKVFPDLFKQDLENALKEQVEIFLMPSLTWALPGVVTEIRFTNYRLLDRESVMLSKEFIREFLAKGEINFFINDKNASPQVRDIYGKGLGFRKDTLIVRGKEVPLNGDSIFLLYFKIIDKKTQKPLRVYY